MQLLRIEHIEVGPSELMARIRVLDTNRMRTVTAPGIATRALALMPGLGRHTCENDDGKRFIAEMTDTEVPHLLEHVTVELMALSGSPRSLKARTSWDFANDGEGVFRVRVMFDDDLVAIAALREAATIVEWLMVQGAPPQAAGPEGADHGRSLDGAPDVHAAVDRLAALRSR